MNVIESSIIFLVNNKSRSKRVQLSEILKKCPNNKKRSYNEDITPPCNCILSSVCENGLRSPHSREVKHAKKVASETHILKSSKLRDKSLLSQQEDDETKDKNKSNKLPSLKQGTKMRTESVIINKNHKKVKVDAVDINLNESVNGKKNRLHFDESASHSKNPLDLKTTKHDNEIVPSQRSRRNRRQFFANLNEDYILTSFKKRKPVKKSDETSTITEDDTTASKRTCVHKNTGNVNAKKTDKMTTTINKLPSLKQGTKKRAESIIINKKHKKVNVDAVDINLNESVNDKKSRLHFDESAPHSKNPLNSKMTKHDNEIAPSQHNRRNRCHIFDNLNEDYIFDQSQSSMDLEDITFIKKRKSVKKSNETSTIKEDDTTASKRSHVHKNTRNVNVKETDKTSTTTKNYKITSKRSRAHKNTGNVVNVKKTVKTSTTIEEDIIIASKRTCVLKNTRNIVDVTSKKKISTLEPCQEDKLLEAPKKPTTSNGMFNKDSQITLRKLRKREKGREEIQYSSKENDINPLKNIKTNNLIDLLNSDEEESIIFTSPHLNKSSQPRSLTPRTALFKDAFEEEHLPNISSDTALQPQKRNKDTLVVLYHLVKSKPKRRKKVRNNNENIPPKPLKGGPAPTLPEFEESDHNSSSDEYFSGF